MTTDVESLIDSLPIGTVVLEPQDQFNGAIIDFDKVKKVLLYDYDLLIDAIAGDMNLADDCVYAVAQDYISYNIMCAPGVKGWPLVVADGVILNGENNEQK